MKEKLAKVIRVISVPPVMVTALVLILYARMGKSFASAGECLLLVLLLGILPVLAYPSQRLLPKFRDGGRDAQRRLAFIFTLVGYSAAMLWSVLASSSSAIRTVTAAYFFSVLILSLLNVFHFKASGHACSVAGPILLLVYFTDWIFLIPGLAFAAAVFWSSLALKRHTLSQLAGGMLTAACAFTAAAALFAH